jgi:ABC-2 type transport system ATP-binding protein
MGAGLRLETVTFGYRRNRSVLHHLTWEPGRRAALLGPNGAGKSTLFAVSSGACRPTSGRVLVDGRSAAAGAVGWMAQDVTAVPGLRCREQVALAGWLHGMGRSAAWSAAGDALDAVGLAGRAGERSVALSGGQRRALGLAEVLVASPKTLLLDEPTVGLDPLQRQHVRQLIDRLGERCQVVVSTHLVDDLDVDFDTVTVLADGAIHFHGTVDVFLALGTGATRSLRAADAFAAIVAAPASASAS